MKDLVEVSFRRMRQGDGQSEVASLVKCQYICFFPVSTSAHKPASFAIHDVPYKYSFGSWGHLEGPRYLSEMPIAVRNN
jgi:hypothetical protein